MSESKHTPGPWEYNDPEKFMQLSGHFSNVAVYAPGNAFPWRMAEIDGPDEETKIANALLIAAAPELLEALTTGAQLNMPDFLEWIAARLVNVHGEDPNVDFVQTLRSRAKLCRVAIAKATGDSYDAQQ